MASPRAFADLDCAPSLPRGYDVEEGGVGTPQGLKGSTTAHGAEAAPSASRTSPAPAEVTFPCFDDVMTDAIEELRGLAKTPVFSSPSSCSSCSLPSDSPTHEATHPAIIAIDNDECIGSWGKAPRGRVYVWLALPTH